MKPNPPTWISVIITTFPKVLQCVAVSKVINPVMHVADVEVNKLSIKLVGVPSADEIGNVSNNAPVKITIANPITNT